MGFDIIFNDLKRIFEKKTGRSLSERGEKNLRMVINIIIQDKRHPYNELKAALAKKIAEYEDVNREMALDIAEEFLRKHKHFYE